MVIDNMALIMVASMLIGLGVLKLALVNRGGNTVYTPDEYGMCAPARYESLTASCPQRAPRRIVAELAPPAGWRDVPPHVAIVPAPAAVAHDDGDPDELPLIVEDWPMPAVVEPDLVPVVVNRWARFSALEVQGQ